MSESTVSENQNLNAMFRPEEPDLLERKELLNSLKNIMNESLKGNSPAISICIDGPWGSGKSWLVEKLN
jgi:Cdc6-like AAA superfamily ATPase